VLFGPVENTTAINIITKASSPLRTTLPRIKSTATHGLALLLLSLPLAAQAKIRTEFWTGTATVRGQSVPVRLQLTGADNAVRGEFHDGPESSASSSGSLQNDHLVLNFDYYARKLDAKINGDTLEGTFGTIKTTYPISLHRSASISTPPIQNAEIAKLYGDWEIALDSPKGESAWTLRIGSSSSLQNELKVVILRIDGDTGGLYGGYNAATQQVLVSHFNASGSALYSIKPQADGTLLVSNLLRDQHWTARRPAEARKENLAPPTATNQQTTVNDPSQPFAFSFPDLTGKTVSSTDSQFKGKVIIVAIGGSWCPNCHDEAPLLVELYNRFHSHGLEVVNISFEEEDQLKDPERLRAFIKRYYIPYNVLVGGTPEQLNEKIPQGKNLNCWPTSFFIGRDGLVKETHAGFAGPATGKSYEELRQETTDLIEKLLKEHAQIASN